MKNCLKYVLNLYTSLYTLSNYQFTIYSLQSLYFNNTFYGQQHTHSTQLRRIYYQLVTSFQLVNQTRGPIDPIVNRGDEDNLPRHLSPSTSFYFHPQNRGTRRKLANYWNVPIPPPLLLHRTKKLQNVGRIDEILLRGRD